MARVLAAACTASPSVARVLDIKEISVHHELIPPGPRSSRRGLRTLKARLVAGASVAAVVSLAAGTTVYVASQAQAAPSAAGTTVNVWRTTADQSSKLTQKAGVTFGSGGSGPVTGYQGLCLDVRSASTADNTPVQVFTCNGTNAQQWTATTSNTLQALGKCLDVKHSGTTDGTPVQLYTCNGTAAQVWQHQANGEYLNHNSGKCLDDTGFGGSGTQVQIRTCTDTANQQWSTAVAPVSSARKGVGVGKFTGANQALAQSGTSWYYNWSTSHASFTTPSGASYVPMIWSAAHVTSQELSEAKAAGSYLLGFNEPDMRGQANMSVDNALQLWPQLQATGMTLGSPAVAYGGNTAGGWLDRFMSEAASKGYRVDFVTLHWYGGDFNTTNAVNQLRSYIQAVYNRYHKPIWLTEFALMRFSSAGTIYPTEGQQAAFLTAATKMLDGLPYLQRYAWYKLGAPDTGDSSGLFRSGPQITPVGQAFQAAS